MERTITAIPATININTATPVSSKEKRKVAAYARVSTDHEEQLSSYEAQVDYYTNYINGRDDWEFAGMYADEGISGTNTKKRDGFNRMVNDALSGSIDLIITKSVSRFARNTIDSLQTIRTLKDHNIECYFEKENIWTFDSKGELLLTIMSSLAQEESRSISENCKWGIRKGFQKGKVSGIPYSTFLGYDKGENGELVINPNQAETVKLIFKLYLEGMSPYTIAKKLTAMGIKTVRGKDVWASHTIIGILTNEKYKGDVLLQKTYVADFLTKKAKVNHGEIEQYYVEGDHEAIIEPEVFDMAQAEMEKRRRDKCRHSGVSIFSSKIKCGECGNWYGAKTWHSNDQYRRTVYQCNHKYKNGTKCSTPHLTEDEIKKIFIKAVNILIKDKEEIINNIEFVIETLCSNTELLKEQAELSKQLNKIAEEAEQYVNRNAHVAQDQNKYNEKYNKLIRKYEKTKEKYDKVSEEILANTAREKELKQFVKTIKEQDLITEFDEVLWSSLADFITVYAKDNIRVTFKDGTEIKV